MTLRIKLIITIMCLLGFIIFISQKDIYKDVGIEELRSAAFKEGSMEDMVEFGTSDIKKEYGFNVNDYGEAFYYGYESVMESDRVLVLKLNEGLNGENIISAISNKNDELKKLFQSYAPDQYTLLDNCILESRDRYVIYIVSGNAKEIRDNILDCIKG